MKAFFKALGKKLIALLSLSVFVVAGTAGAAVFAGNFQFALDETVDTSQLQQVGFETNLIDTLEGTISSGLSSVGEGEGVRDFLLRLAEKVIIPLLLAGGIGFAIRGFIKLMFADGPEALTNALKIIGLSFLAVLIIMSAKYLIDQLVGIENPGQGNIISILTGGEAAKQGPKLINQIYQSLFLPFIELLSNLLLGVLFIIALVNAVRYIFSTDSAAQKTFLSALLFSIVGIIVIIVAKELVEAVFGTYNEVVGLDADGNPILPGNTGDVGSGIFSNIEFELLFGVVNWALGLAAFIVLLIIIYLGYRLLTQPNDEGTLTSIGKTIGYIFMGIFVVGGAYLLANFFILQTA